MRTARAIERRGSSVTFGKKMKLIEKAPRFCAWLLFTVSCGALMAVDYALRLRTGDLRLGGVPESLWFGFPVFVGAMSLTLIWRGALNWKREWIRAIEVLGHACLGTLLYFAAGLYYVLGTGIDTL